MCRHLLVGALVVAAASAVFVGTAGGADPNLVAWWTFDNNTNDVSGNARNGTAYGSPTYVGGATYGASQPFYAENAAIWLAGTAAAAQYVDLPVGDLMPKLLDCTFAVWVNYRQTGGGNRWQRIFDFGSSTTNYVALLPRRSSSAPTHFEINVNGTVQRVSYGPYSGAGTTIPTYQWVHLAVTIDDVNDVWRMYFNGREVGTTTGTNATFAPIDVGVTTMNYLGRAIPVVEGPYWPGYIDHFGIYNRTLSETAVRESMGFPVATFPSPGDGTALPTTTQVLPADTTSVTLSWVKGAGATLLNGSRVYFGTNQQDVINGTGGTDKGLTSATTYTPAGIVPGPTYYWRIDTLGAGNAVWPGLVWSFRIMAPAAWEPRPADTATLVAPKAPVRWNAGTGATLGHNVYLSDSFDQVNNAAVGSTASPFRVFVAAGSDPNWTPANAGINLAFGKTYYWRVDEVQSQTVLYKGAVWSFTIVPHGPPAFDPNLVGWWKLDGNLRDDAYGCDGTAIGNPTYAGSLVGEAIFFDNTNDSNNANDIYATLPIGSVISSLTNCTFAVWVNRMGDEGDRVHQRFFAFSTVPANSMYLSPRVSASAPTHFQISAGGVTEMVGYGGNAANSGSIIPGNEWHHLAVTVDADNDVFTLYLDGVQVGQRTDSTLTPSQLGMTTNNVLGRSEDPIQQRPYRGYVDDLRIYNRVLTEAEINRVMTPLSAYSPRPRSGATDASDMVVLLWQPGGKAVQQNVYFGTDANAVAAASPATAGIFRGTVPVSQSRYVPTEDPLTWGQTYYWRVDEVNTLDPLSPWGGVVWNFSVGSFVIVDDFESYDQVCDRVYYAWRDGYPFEANPTCQIAAYTGNQTGALVDPNGAIIHAGQSSMRISYNNLPSPYYSEARREWPTAQDWTRKGVKSLSLWFRGAATSTPAALYMVVEDSTGKSKTFTHSDPNAAVRTTWQEWNIDLKELSTAGLNLAAIKKMTIGMDNRANLQTAGSGVMYFDDIRLYPPRCRADVLKPVCDLNNDCIVDYRDLDLLAADWLAADRVIATTAPIATGLAAYWPLDGNGNDASGNGNTGTLAGGAAWVATGLISGALQVNGVDGYLDCVTNPVLNITSRVTLAAWVNTSDSGNSQYNPFVAKGDTSYGLQHNSNNTIEFYIYDAGAWYNARYAVTSSFNNVWHHVAGTYDGTQLKVYVDGVLRTTTNRVGAIATSAFPVNIGRNSEQTTRFYAGLIDDVRIYSRALSDAEMAYLADTTPADGQLHVPTTSAANFSNSEPDGSQYVNFKDYAVLAAAWLQQLLWPQP